MLNRTTGVFLLQTEEESYQHLSFSHMAKLTHARLLCKMEAPSLPIQAASRGEESEGTSGAIQGGVIMRQRNHPSRPAPQLCPLPACEPAAGGGAGCARGCGCVAANCWESSGLGSQDSGSQEHRKAVAAVPRPATVVGSDRRRRRRRLAHEGREGGIGGAPRPRVWMHNNFPNP